MLTGIKQTTSSYLAHIDCTINASIVFVSIPSSVRPINAPLLYPMHWAVYTSSNINVTILSRSVKVTTHHCRYEKSSFSLSTVVVTESWRSRRTVGKIKKSCSFLYKKLLVSCHKKIVILWQKSIGDLFRELE